MRTSVFQASRIIYDWLALQNEGHPEENVRIPWHFVSNQLIEIGGDKADLRFFLHNRSSTVGGIFYAKTSRTADGWRIDDLVLEDRIRKND